MKKSIALLISLVLCLGVVSPALAYNGVSGQVVDSNGTGWTNGGDVLIIDTNTNMIIATCMLDGTGNLVGTPGPAPCPYGSTTLFGFVPPGAVDGNGMKVVIDFTCSISGSPCGGSVDTPDPITITYSEATPLGSQVYDLGDIPTGTGPNAVQLSGMSSASSLSLALVLALVAGGSILIKKRLYKVGKPVYVSPEVTYEGDLEVKAGSSSSDIMDELVDQLK